MTYKLGKDGWPTDETVIDMRDREIESLRQQIAELQAREKVLRDAMSQLSMDDGVLTGWPACYAALKLPQNSTALDTLKKQWQREALLDAAEQMESYCGPTVYYELHNRAKELEETK